MILMQAARFYALFATFHGCGRPEAVKAACVYVRTELPARTAGGVSGRTNNGRDAWPEKSTTTVGTRA